jgi:hypothetical protein
MQVSDEGSGIRRSGLPRIFTYLYSTASNPPELLDGANEGSSMSGYGFGLPIILAAFTLDTSAATCKSSRWKDMVRSCSTWSHGIQSARVT